ncbi:MAG: 5-carboxymethyl-2-hydroxymuconate isomerase [Bacilli bacterium]|nr:5-carboxymethyl-2-hydroxymuconate isomerase [Bacilli bacterium]
MKLLTIRKPEGLKLGIKTEQGVLDISAALESVGAGANLPETMEEVLSVGGEALAKLEKYVNQVAESGRSDLFVKEDTVAIGPAVPNPGKIICVGTNYRRHAEESKMPIPQVPIIFNKFNNTIAAHGDVIDIPFNTTQADYEAELTIVIGKTAKRVSTEQALDYVIGYCNVNDLSARDLQFRTHQWLLGKSCDGFSPVGPYLVTSDEVGDPNSLKVRTYVNGEIRQNSNTSDMIFSCAEIVSYISQHMTLNAGDIILTGTPEGVVFNGFDGKVTHHKPHLQWLKDGDEITIEVEKLGRLTNRMRQEV